MKPVSKSEVEPRNAELSNLKETLRDTQHVGVLVNCCKTLDQAKAVLKFIDAISEKSLRSTVSLTASRGRGKSAALGLAVAGAVACGYSNIFVTGPSPENLKTFFEFIFKGFDALEYQEHLDYSLVRSTNPDFNKALVRVNIFRDHRQTIQYLHPSDHQRLGQCELLVIDEAAAIPLPLVKAMLGPYLVFLASTINGYEGTGRSLSLKLLQQLRTQAAPSGAKGEENKDQSAATGRALAELTLNESIRYAPGDAVEKWLTDLLCLDATSVQPLLSGCPPPDQCDLYYINRDTLFCYHKASEAFLQRLVSLYVASHYKNSPNDLQMMSDAPAHHLFCLLGPVDANTKSLPEVLVVIQVCLEGQLSRESASDGLTRGKRAAGDLIPWTIGQQFQDKDFPMLAGARVVRIATHPDYQGMGYGRRALDLLRKYYEGAMPYPDDENDENQHQIEPIEPSSVGLLEETIEPRKTLPPLLLKLTERKPESLDYLGVSYGLTRPLLKFWKKAGFVPVYLRQTTNELTGEHSCIMLTILNGDGAGLRGGASWLTEYFMDFKRRAINLLGYQFRTFEPALALSLITNKSVTNTPELVSATELPVWLTKYDLKRLDMYSSQLADFHLIMDLMPALSRLFFLDKLGDTHLSAVQSAILLGLGLQQRTVESVSEDLDLATTQALGLFNRIIRRVTNVLNGVMARAVEEQLGGRADTAELPELQDGAKSMRDELEVAAKELKEKQQAELQKLKKENLAAYAIKGSEEEWGNALKSGNSKNIISVKSGEKRPSDNPPEDEEYAEEKPNKKKKKNNFNKKHNKK